MTMSGIMMTPNLSEIYPDVGEELCNKHSKQLSKLKSLFGDIYDGN
jgi:spore coat protein CotF